jgi:hypothetical protein
MSKKDYLAGARMIELIEDRVDRQRTARRFADFFRARNDRFDRGRFYLACGLTAVEISELG